MLFSSSFALQSIESFIIKLETCSLQMEQMHPTDHLKLLINTIFEIYKFSASNANKIFNITYVTVLGTQRNDKSFLEKNKEEKLLVKHRKKNVLSIVLQSFATSTSCTVLLLVKLSNMYYSTHFPTDEEKLCTNVLLLSVPLKAY